ncbi:O-antigen ligase family protein [Muribaculum intestinale]|uniref:O-antigen ligase family protein n=1 Tax=Muribaculum intestinale TaxID=1796646 RepID=UPI00272DA831|nr:O-antigen ligase family protein [Muribaculum intestinale]
MIRIDRICIWLFLSALVLLLVSHKFLKPVDESITVFLLGIALADSILNNKWRSYIPLWILLGITLVYIIYSLTGVHFNTTRYVLTDALIEIKPYVPFLVCLGISPKWSNVDLRLLQTCALFVAVITTGILLTGPSNTNMIFEHQSFAGLIIYICALCYWFGCITPDGQVTHRDKLIIILIMTGGLLCTRSKFYGYYVLGIFFMFFYRPGILKQINMKHLAMIVSLIIVFIAVSWKKISFYFITGNSDSFDPNVMESFARPVMYLHGFTILFDYFPFGSGLASFASFPSAENYSSLYYEYGLNNIHGLSPDMPDFICDAFYPTLAQFGIIGVILFITFWVYTYRFLRMMIRKNPILYINQFSIGALTISAMLIECVASTSFVQPSGQVAMMLLGMICSVSKSFSGDATIENATSTLTTDNKKRIKI